MTARGWRKERVLRTTDTVGRPITVTTGLTTDNDGADVVGLAISGGPSAVIALDRGTRLLANLRSSLTDLHDHLAERDNRPGGA
jgi:hypothetical protein